MEAGLFGRAEDWPRRDLIGYSEEFDAVVALAAYRQGVFPMPLDPRAMGWWSPMYRGVMRVPEVRVTRSLRQSARRYTTTVDAAFPRVLAACADPHRDGGWIDSRIRERCTAARGPTPAAERLSSSGSPAALQLTGWRMPRR